MLYDDFRAALYQMSDMGDLVLPYGIVPPIDEKSDLTSEMWDSIDWNPPVGFGVDHLTEPDPAASPKPSYDTVVNIYNNSVEPVPNRGQELRDKARSKITGAYGAHSWEDEIQMRLRGETTAEQDVERDRLRAVYKTELAKVKAMTRAQLKAYDPLDDTIWAKPAEDDS